MLTIKKETLQQKSIRHINILRRAHSRKLYKTLNCGDLYKIVRASVRAAIPGRQQASNLNEVMEKAIKSAARSL